MAADASAFELGNSAKANFDDIYNAPDPRAYYTTLGRLDYQIPSQAKPVFQAVMQSMERERLTVLDIGCSYGVNAAMLRYDLDFAHLVHRYDRPAMEERSVAEVIVRDAETFAAMPERTDATFIGLDVAAEAAGYAKAVGLIEEAVVANLEESSLPEDAAARIAGADLIITTGAIGYVTEQTFEKILDAAGATPPWVAAFTLRQFPFDAIADTLARRGLVAERLEHRQFPQRRFRDDEEREGAIAAIRAAGRDPEGIETTGGYFSEFYLAAPSGRSSPLARLAL